MQRLRQTGERSKSLISPGQLYSARPAFTPQRGPALQPSSVHTQRAALPAVRRSHPTRPTPQPSGAHTQRAPHSRPSTFTPTQATLQPVRRLRTRPLQGRRGVWGRSPRRGGRGAAPGDGTGRAAEAKHTTTHRTATPSNSAATHPATEPPAQKPPEAQAHRRSAHRCPSANSPRRA